MKYGTVYIVGAGPGDPGLLTLKALKLIKEADVILFDRLVNERILEYAKLGAKLMYVGKKTRNHAIPQKKINKLLLSYAEKYKKIVRLKGGDPFIFGRGGEEAEYLAKHKVLFEIVPGITSAIAASSYAGIPLTHRDYDSQVTFITGHRQINKTIDWENLAATEGTLVFLMGMENLKNIVKNLISFGMSPEVPVAIIRRGTTPEQKAITGKLENIYSKVNKNHFHPPCIIVIGKVVNLMPVLSWYEKKPLFGKGILVTRARKQADSLMEKLEEYGAKIYLLPAIKIKELNSAKINKIVKNISNYDWIIFTSQNGVDIFFKKLAKLKKDSRSLGNAKIACMGDKTSLALERFGIKADIVPENFIAESLVKAFKGINLKSKKILIPRARESRNILEYGLEKMGAKVEILPIYETVPEKNNTNEIKKAIKDNKIDTITFTSSSTVKFFDKLLKKDIKKDLKHVEIACIGPVTANAARKLGYKVSKIARTYTIDGLVESILKR